MAALGRHYPEIKQFQRMPGMGVVGSHVFSAFSQIPHRLATKQKLWRYCQFGIIGRSSAGKPLVRKRLDRSGTGILKAASHQCRPSALRTKNPNEVTLFYEASLRRTGNPVHARLHTQRNVLTVLWTIWNNNVDYNPIPFYSLPKSAVIEQALENP